MDINRLINPVCDCGKKPQLMTGFELYKMDELENKLFWVCQPCAKHVGVHRKGCWIVTPTGKVYSDGTLAMGTLAGTELRAARSRLHRTLDIMDRKDTTLRKLAYSRLAAELGISVYDCHIGYFDLETCTKAENIILGWRKK